jgi:hypothetical protein
MFISIEHYMYASTVPVNISSVYKYGKNTGTGIFYMAYRQDNIYTRITEVPLIKYRYVIHLQLVVFLILFLILWRVTFVLCQTSEFDVLQDIYFLIG